MLENFCLSLSNTALITDGEVFLCSINLKRIIKIRKLIPTHDIKVTKFQLTATY